MPISGAGSEEPDLTGLGWGATTLGWWWLWLNSPEISKVPQRLRDREPECNKRKPRSWLGPGASEASVGQELGPGLQVFRRPN